MSPQRGTAGAARDQRERGRSVTRHLDRNIQDWAHRGTERAPAQSRPRGSGPGRGGELMAQRAQERGTQGERKERPRGTKRHRPTRGSGKGCQDKEDKVQYEASGRLEASTVRGGVDGGEEQRCTTSTTRVGRANSGTEGAAGCKAQVAVEIAARLRAQTRCHVCRKMSHKPEPKPSQLPAAEVAPLPRAVSGYGGPGLVGVRVEMARMQADSAPQPPSPTFSAASTEVSSASSPQSLETVQREGPRKVGQQRKEEAAAGTGEGGDKGGQAEASGGRTEVFAAESEGQGEVQGQQAVVRRRADPFNIAELMPGRDIGRGESVVDDISVVSEDEGQKARRMAVEGGPGQPTAPNVLAAAMKSILPEMQRKEEDKGRQGQPAAGAAEGGEGSVRTGGRGRTGKRGKGQARTSGARHATGHQEENGEKRGGQGRHWPQPQRSFKQPPPGSPPQVSAAVRAEEERRGTPAGGAVRGAGAHGAPAPSPPAPGARSRHHLPAEDAVREDRVRAPGRTGGVGRGAQRTAQWRAAERGRAGRTEQRSGGGAPRPAGGRARGWELAKWTGRQRGAGQGCGTRRRR